MRKLRWWVWFLLGLLLWMGIIAGKQALPLQAQAPGWSQLKPAQLSRELAQRVKGKDFEPFAEVIADSEKLEGFLTLYQNQEQGNLYLSIKPEQLNQNYLCITTLSTGLGEGWLLRGMPLNDFMFSFRRLQNNIQFVLPNINFRTHPGNTSAPSLDNSFSDSVLYSLPIISINPQDESILIDLADLILNAQDIPGLSQELAYALGGSYSLDASNSYFSSAQAFPSNIEVESVYGFSSPGDAGMLNYLPSLPDSRAFNLAVHYSFSPLPANNGYVPRLADDRLGYFVTAYKDLSEQKRDDGFVRYIQRWHLEPSDPSQSLSPPKEPIVFWLENTIPSQYREAMKRGVLMWNKAFAQAGYQDVLEVRQMPDHADWSPADVRYNTIRWSSSLNGWFLGIGPSRTNPLTGEILDADIVINAEVVDLIKNEYRNLSGLGQSEQMSSEYLSWCLSPERQQEDNPSQSPWLKRMLEEYDFCYGAQASQQLGVGAMAMSLLSEDVITDKDAQMEEYINQYLSYLIAHEVGHTLGLRHNFHGSTMLMPEELNDTSITSSKGLLGSVMDYAAVNLAPPGVEQGDYFSTVVGPYDRWAIEYGYKPSGERYPEAEVRFLETIASRAAEPGLAYATDEDAFGFADPEVNAFDLSGDVLNYAQWQMDNAQKMWQRLNKRYPIAGDSYSDIRRKFNQVFGYYFQQAYLVSKYVGGRSFNRDHPGDPNGRLPFESVPLDQQRQALQVLQKYIFDRDALQFSPELLNQLAPSRWSHWGHPAPMFSLDYPIHDNIFFVQSLILHSLLSGERLNSLRDLELKTQPGEALTLPELFDTLTEGIWMEVLEPKNQRSNISSIRRSLQREYLEILTNMVLRRTPVPEDARTLAWYQLRQLEPHIGGVLHSGRNELDTYTKAHLAETRDRILKTLDAQLEAKEQNKLKVNK